MFTEHTEYTSSRAQSFCTKDLLIFAQYEILHYALDDVPGVLHTDDQSEHALRFNP